MERRGCGGVAVVWEERGRFCTWEGVKGRNCCLTSPHLAWRKHQLGALKAPQFSSPAGDLCLRDAH
ncbi:hypothetical protein E2C01_063341 [Portunus trituberculatus]|uniref:Uncharacterized protein n=1 Tax=Portunus trituberculatus TaxID=210409 RepID=A0A5B7HIP5_PORTR|nr:hypothetical protein [Portunus trituberculatus]